MKENSLAFNISRRRFLKHSSICSLTTTSISRAATKEEFSLKWKQIERSNLIIFTKKKPPIHLLKKVKKTNIPIFQSITTPEISNHSPNKSELDLKNKNVFLASGIGNPVFFRETVKDMGGVIKGEKVFPDHYKYKNSDIKFVHFTHRNNKPHEWKDYKNHA